MKTKYRNVQDEAIPVIFSPNETLDFIHQSQTTVKYNESNNEDDSLILFDEELSLKKKTKKI